MFTLTQILAEAQRLLGDSSRWTWGADARDEEERIVVAESDSAVQFSAQGAIRRTCQKWGSDFLEGQATMAFQVASGAEIQAFNDAETRHHREVLRAFDRAIELAKRLR